MAPYEMASLFRALTPLGSRLTHSGTCETPTGLDNNGVTHNSRARHPRADSSTSPSAEHDSDPARQCAMADQQLAERPARSVKIAFIPTAISSNNLLCVAHCSAGRHERASAQHKASVKGMACAESRGAVVEKAPQ